MDLKIPFYMSRINFMIHTYETILSKLYLVNQQSCEGEKNTRMRVELC